MKGIHSLNVFFSALVPGTLLPRGHRFLLSLQPLGLVLVFSAGTLSQELLSFIFYSPLLLPGPPNPLGLVDGSWWLRKLR